MNQLSNTLWYTQTPMEHQQQQTYPFFYLNNNNHVHNYDDVNSDNNSTSNAETASSTTITTPTPDKEHMFEKPLTPSDVGKLNRLVIPKQHAEKYLPLSAVSAASAADTGGGGGLLLGFEDETGKSWKFRYSYWNSSQSYVLTKGWSRYVKEKKLDAGDVVLFERHRFEPDRLFIGWRRRGTNSPIQPSSGWTGRSSSSYNFNNNNNHNNYNYQYNNNHQQNVVQSQQSYTPSHQISVFPNFPTENVHEGTVQVRQKAKKSGNSKRVRLFGVNLECQLEEEVEQAIDYESQTSDGSSLSSQSQGQGQGYGSGSTTIAPTSYNYYDYMGYPPNHHEHMDMNFSHDSNQQMRNRLG